MAGQNNFPFVINVGNSIIGVTILAMPFCFQACGIILGSLLLLFSTWLTLVSCHLLLKAGITSRRRSYSFLAYYTHGATGKLIVEIGMIGLQLGTLVAQVVIIGDLGPAILSKATGLPNSDNLRTGFIIFLCLFLGLPLGLLKDVRMLSKTSTACIMFYSFFSFYIIIQSLPNLVKGQWFNKVNFWRMEGFFQCLPIFSFAFGCQTQMFIVYEALAEPSLKRMNGIVSSAVNMCAIAYLLVGFFGNVAFCDTEISGDIINNFKQNSLSDGIKLCFVFSIAVSIPLIVFPCRLSLYNLLFPQKPKEDVPGSGKIPEFHFKVITTLIIVGSMIIGIMVPNVEFVLGINGATMGTLICYIFPAMFFLNVMATASEGKWTARLVLIFGLTILIASTYTTLSSQDKKVEAARAEDINIGEIGDNEIPAADRVEKIIEDLKPPEEHKIEDAGAGPPVDVDAERQEPPNPQAPNDKEEAKEPDKKADTLEEVNKGKETDIDNDKETDIGKDKETDIDKDKETHIDKDKETEKNIDKRDDHKVKMGDTGDKLKDSDKKVVEPVRSDKELKDDKEKEEEKEKLQKEKLEDTEKKQEAILGKLAEQQEEQQKLIKEQKEILEELKQHKEEHIEKEKKEAPDNQQQNIQQQVQNQEIGGQQAQNLQPVGAQAGGNQQVVLNQQNIQQGAQQAIQPLEGQQFLPNQAVRVQQGLQNQQLGGQQFVQNQQLRQNQQGGQVLQNQPIAGQNVLQNQPIAGQNVLQNQPIAGQNVLQNQPIAGQNVLQNQPIAGQNVLQNQPIAGQNVLQNQPIGGQQVLQQVQQNQQVGGQQQVVQSQGLGGQPVLQNQQMGGQNVLQNQQQAGQALQGAQQQQILNQPVNQQGNINQNVLQNYLRMPAQAQHNLPAGNGDGQLANGIPVVTAGVQNMQGGQQLANQAQAGQQVVQPVAAGNNPQNIDVKQEQNLDGPLNHEMNPVVKDDALKRIKRDVELSNDQHMDNEQLNVAANNEVGAEGHQIIEIHDKEKRLGNKDSYIVADKDKPVAINNDQSDNAGNKADINKQDENGNIQRDLKQIKPTVPSGDAGAVIKSYDYVDEVIDNMKKNLYSDGDRKNPFVVEMVDKGKSR